MIYGIFVAILLVLLLCAGKLRVGDVRNPQKKFHNGDPSIKTIPKQKTRIMYSAIER